MSSDPFQKFLQQNSKQAPKAPADEFQKILAKTKVTDTPPTSVFRRNGLGGAIVAFSFVVCFLGVQHLSTTPGVPVTSGVMVASTPTPWGTDDQIDSYLDDSMGALDAYSLDDSDDEEFLL